MPDPEIPLPKTAQPEHPWPHPALERAPKLLHRRRARLDTAGLNPMGHGVGSSPPGAPPGVGAAAPSAESARSRAQLGHRGPTSGLRWWQGSWLRHSSAAEKPLGGVETVPGWGVGKVAMPNASQDAAHKLPGAP